MQQFPDPFTALDPVKANKVFVQLRSHLTIEGYRQAYLNFVPKYDPRYVNFMSELEFRAIAAVFKFTKLNDADCKAELNRWVKYHWDVLYGESWTEISQKMWANLATYNTSHGTPFQFLNWCPGWGGMIQQKFDPIKDQEAFMREHKISMMLTGNPPKKENKDKRRMLQDKVKKLKKKLKKKNFSDDYSDSDSETPPVPDGPEEFPE
jgi:hypothetical protein